MYSGKAREIHSWRMAVRSVGVAAIADRFVRIVSNQGPGRSSSSRRTGCGDSSGSSTNADSSAR
ncbi:hypothetical protein [Streptomyces sp. GbtcB7]|uniref:hypothetical protein n=1 Tax=Streptomyces sp. GbtcB7 TaxID=2824752 RepID=UPI001C304453|nr:hypothetical protein [Streptomyces sp. GbtcB7]